MSLNNQINIVENTYADMTRIRGLYVYDMHWKMLMTICDWQYVGRIWLVLKTLACTNIRIRDSQLTRWHTSICPTIIMYDLKGITLEIITRYLLSDNKISPLCVNAMIIGITVHVGLKTASLLFSIHLNPVLSSSNWFTPVSNLPPSFPTLSSSVFP